MNKITIVIAFVLFSSFSLFAQQKQIADTSAVKHHMDAIFDRMKDMKPYTLVPDSDVNYIKEHVQIAEVLYPDMSFDQYKPHPRMFMIDPIRVDKPNPDLIDAGDPSN